MEINELLQINNADEEKLLLNNLFNNITLIKYTYSELKYNIDHFDNMIQAIDYTIDDLYTMYTESIKTRYILVSICTFYILKLESQDVFVKLKDFFSSPNVPSRDVEKYLFNFLEEISLNISNTPLQNYLVKLVHELLLLFPNRLSKTFNKLNYTIVKVIETEGN